MDILRPLLLRAATLFGVLIAVLVLLAVSLGATGFSDRILEATVGEEIRGLRTSLAQTIRDPDELEQTLQTRATELRASYGLDRPWWVRIPGLVRRVLTLDLGDARSIRSYEGSTRIADIILERLPNTILLLTTSTLLVALIGIAAGVWMSTRVGSRIDRFVTYLAAISNALPTWWLGILLILLFTYQLRWLPSEGMYSVPPPEGGFARFLDLLWHSVLPVMTLVLVSIGPSIYSIRTLTLNIAQEDHVNVARAKGMPERIVLWRHILRVAAPPIVTGLILGLAGSLGGSILVETIFNWQGMGRLYYDAIAGTPDEGLIVALTFMFTLIYVLARLLLEFLYLVLDPRVRYEETVGRPA
ncbi:MAG TPA: ABC transporter permease [Meiothermus sp.]|nr:ABC transporter permease [Meiothermus sp.]